MPDPSSTHPPALPQAVSLTGVRAPRKGRSGLALYTVRYLMRTEVHTFAFSVAANAILSLFPVRGFADDAHPARVPFARHV